MIAIVPMPPEEGRFYAAVMFAGESPHGLLLLDANGSRGVLTDRPSVTDTSVQFASKICGQFAS